MLFSSGVVGEAVVVVGVIFLWYIGKTGALSVGNLKWTPNWVYIFFYYHVQAILNILWDKIVLSTKNNVLSSKQLVQLLLSFNKIHVKFLAYFYYLSFNKHCILWGK